MSMPTRSSLATMQICDLFRPPGPSRSNVLCAVSQAAMFVGPEQSMRPSRRLEAPEARTSEAMVLVLPVPPKSDSRAPKAVSLEVLGPAPRRCPPRGLHGKPHVYSRRPPEAPASRWDLLRSSKTREASES